MLQKWFLKIQVYFLKKPKFRIWTELEDRKYDFLQATEDDIPNLSDKLYDYLSVALRIPVDYSKIFWKDLVEEFYKIHSVTSTIRKIPITSNQARSKSKKDEWDYSGRLWYLYANMIASAYGWTEKQIANLSVDDALAYLQEILTDKQLHKEFIWSTTEIAYPYDKGTKKSKFHPLERPYWMVNQGVSTSKHKAAAVPKAMLPVGNIMKVTGEIENREIETHGKTENVEFSGDVESVSPIETSN